MFNTMLGGEETGERAGSELEQAGVSWSELEQAGSEGSQS